MRNKKGMWKTNAGQCVLLTSCCCIQSIVFYIKYSPTAETWAIRWDPHSIPPSPPRPTREHTRDGIGNRVLPASLRGCPANEGPVKIQYKCLVSIYEFPEMKLCMLGYFQKRIIMFRLSIPAFICLWEIHIFPGSVCLRVFCCNQICGPILGIYKLLTNTWI